MFLKVHVYLKIRKLHYLISIVHKYLAGLYHNVLRIKVCDKVRRINGFYWKKAQTLLSSKYRFLSDFFETFKIFILAQKCHEGVNLLKKVFKISFFNNLKNFWRLVNSWNLKSKLKFHVFPSRQDWKGPFLYYVRLFWGFFEPPTHPPT